MSTTVRITLVLAALVACVGCKPREPEAPPTAVVAPRTSLLDKVEQENQTPPPSAARLRFNGLYVAAGDPPSSGNAADAYSYYLRFYPSGVAITVSSTGSPAEVVSWFNPADPEMSRGKYTLRENHISFDSTDSYGTVEYEGEIEEDGIHLRTHSLINGHRGSYVFKFIRDPR